MIDSINWIVSSILFIFFIIGLTCSILVKRKYGAMLKTIKALEQDKDVIKIKRFYDKTMDKHKCQNTLAFIEKEYYDIKINKIPMVLLEEIGINAMYYIVLLGLTFTFLEIALQSNAVKLEAAQVFTCSIVGIVLGLVLLIFRTAYGLGEKRDMFVVNMCHYLDNTREHRNKVKDEDIEGNKSNNQDVQEVEEETTVNPEDLEGFVYHQKAGGHRDECAFSSEESEEQQQCINDQILEDVIEEIMS